MITSRVNKREGVAGKGLWSIPYADDAGIMSPSSASIDKMLTVCALFGVMVAEKGTEAAHTRAPGASVETLEIKAANGVSKQTYLLILGAPSPTMAP